MEKYFVCIVLLALTFTNPIYAGESKKSSGTIKGKLGYAGDEVPAMAVCAEMVTTNKTTCVNTKEGASSFSLSVQSGSYFVFAHLLKNRGGCTTSYRAYYDEMVKCGLSVECKSHAPIEVRVLPGQTVSNIEPVDWYNQKP